MYKKIKKYKKNSNYKGGINMETRGLRSDKLALKALLMKNVKTDNRGRVLLSQNDEWRKETEWDDIYKELTEERR